MISLNLAQQSDLTLEDCKSIRAAVLKRFHAESLLNAPANPDTPETLERYAGAYVDSHLHGGGYKTIAALNMQSCIQSLEVSEGMETARELVRRAQGKVAQEMKAALKDYDITPDRVRA